ncbi:DUF3313 domain-containing protein [Sulfuricaulis sp.]|uniref:DUF3313 domain-containing protein n=1 Tax=Sulfuricaulis sp. TaxID=2003553 RepID=UPI00355A1498
MMTSLTRTLTVFAVAIAIAMPFAANASDTLVKKEQYSGFLKDYSQLKEEKDAKGDKVMRYISPKLTSGKYSKVMIDRVEFYPAPHPDKNVDSATLDQIRDYFDQALRQKIGEKTTVVDQAGPGVVRMRVALTAVAAETAALKAYQYIPIALIVQGVKGAAGARAKNAELCTELEVLDSQSGERIGAVVKKGTGTEVKKVKEGEDKGEKMVALDNVKPILDNWAQLAADFAGKNLRPR